jgi:GT2 family glycosyltransferase
MINNKEIAIIILNWNTYQYTHNCIISLNYNNFKNFKIIVVDNGSKDNSLDLLKNDFENIKFIKNKINLGFSGGNNIGIRYALSQKFKYIMLLNNDVEVEKDFITPLLKKLKENRNTAAVQPLILNFSDKSTIWNAGGTINNFFGLPLTRHKPKKSEDKTSWITGCCILIKSEVINEVGLLDENFFAYYEDVDWSIRIKSLKYNLVFVNDSVIYHHGSVSSKVNNYFGEGYLSPFAHYLNIRNHLFLLRKHKNLFNFFGVIFFQTFKIISYSIYFLIRLRFNKLSMVFKGVIHGLNNK